MVKSNGSKHTELPSGWEILEFGEFAELRKSKYVPNESESLKCLELEHFNQETGDINGWIDSNLQKSTKNVFKKGDVLFGKLRPYLKKYWKAEFNGVSSSEVWVLKSNLKICDTNFLFRLVQTHRFIQVANVSSGSKMPRADWDYVSSYPFILPPLPEQRAIANILSTWDTAIQTTQALISQKEQEKKWLMQNLLTGKKRLKEFSGEWKEEKIGEIGEIQTGNTPSKQDPENWGKEFNWCTADDMKNKYIENTSQKLSPQGWRQARKVPAGSVLITCIASIGINAITKVETGFNQQINSITPLKNYNAEFVYYLIDFSRNKLLEYAGAGALPMLNKNTFMGIKFKFPEFEEQTAIAQVLQTADKEIELLKTKLEQQKLQKKGLMQVLLTGKVRVNLN